MIGVITLRMSSKRLPVSHEVLSDMKIHLYLF